MNALRDEHSTWGGIHDVDEQEAFALALNEQRETLWAAEAVIESVASALQQHFGSDWPAGVPDFARALRQAAALIEAATGALEFDSIEHRAVGIAREQKSAEVAS
jgi:hypothetical protein